MSLNITIAGDIYSSAGDIIEASLQVFVNNTNNSKTKWSDVFSTEDGSYNKNLGDPDLSSQDNTLGLGNGAGEFVVIAVWADGNRNGNDGSDTPSEFAYIVHELSGENVYVQDIKLGKPAPIKCNDWTVTPEIIQGQNIVALNNNTNESKYTEFEKEHFLYRLFMNEVVFGFMGATDVLFDFGKGYSHGNVYTPETGGDITVHINVKDAYDTSVFCEKTVKVFYDVQPGFTDDPGNYVLNDDITINGNPTGHISKIKETKYVFYDDTIIGDFTRTLTSVGTIPVTQYITFFNAYEDVTVSLHRDIAMQNIPPEINLQAVKEPGNDMAKKDYTFAHNGTDIDGFIAKVQWEIYRNNPDVHGNENWSLYYTTGPIADLSDWEYNIDDIVGDLKIKATVYDNMGATASQEFAIENDCSDIQVSFANIDWTKKIKTIDFGLTVTKKTFTQNTKRIAWDMKPKKVQWDMKPIKKEFKINVNKIDWKYKIFFDV